MSVWSVEPSVVIPVTLTAVVYLGGWNRLRRRLPRRIRSRHAVIFTAGLATMLLALSFPVERLAERWLSAHMVQHMLLMVVVAPLLWMGAPVGPLVAGLPRPIRRVVLAVTNAPGVRAVTRWILHPSVGWTAFALSFWVWHIPALYALALESHVWHHVEHACFLGSALLFWRPVILAWPARAIWPRWTMIPYLGLAMFQGMPLAAILTFSDRVIYRGYSSLDDQALAGAIMWLPGSFPLLIPLLRLSVELSAGRVVIERSHVSEGVPRVVIVGGGFGGLAAAKALRKSNVEVILIDRQNHHLFQPLLYQVATSVLSPGQIASPIRGILGKQRNTTVILAEVTGVDAEGRRVFVDSVDRPGVAVGYDYLIVATGASHSYFGHDEFEPFAPGLKSLADAVSLRNRILTAFEQAEAEEDPKRHRDLLTFVLVGAGPTGVEMAGAMAELVRQSLRSEFRRIDPTSARIVLIDASKRVLGTFPEKLAIEATRRLEKLGVEVRLGHGVDHIDADGANVAGEHIASKTVIWTAGVAPSPAGKWLEAATDRAGRVRVQPDLSVSGHPEIFVVGDTTSLDQDGRPLPGVAQVAMQQGRYAARLIRRRIAGQAALKPFRYFDKGTMAVVGKGFAVLHSGWVNLSGFLAWMAWAAVHLQFLAQSSLRVSVFVQWVWTYLTGQGGSRLIVNHHESRSWAKPAVQDAASKGRNGREP